MGFKQSEIDQEEWKVVELIASQLQKNPSWLANFKSNMANDSRIVKWDLRRVGLTSLPEEFGRLTMLEGVDLMGNSIRILPSSFGNLRNLQSLEINPGVIFPPEICQLAKLREIRFGEGRVGGCTTITPRVNVENVLRKLESGYYAIFEWRTPVHYFSSSELDSYLQKTESQKSGDW